MRVQPIVTEAPRLQEVGPALSEFFRKRRQADAVVVYLFGSVARGDSDANSDIDVAVLLTHEPAPTLVASGFRLEGELEAALGRAVQVVLLNCAPVDLVHRVLRDGHLVHETDPAARVRFETEARREYFDLLPILHRYRKAGGAMIDTELVTKRLAFVETCVGELRSLARAERLADDIRERRFVEHTLQLGIQAIIDVAAHIVSAERLGEPRTQRELFDFLTRSGWIDSPLSDRLRDMVGFRNVLIHGYTDVDLEIVRDVLGSRLVDLEAFGSAIRQRLQSES